MFDDRGLAVTCVNRRGAPADTDRRAAFGKHVDAHL